LVPIGKRARSQIRISSARIGLDRLAQDFRKRPSRQRSTRLTRKARLPSSTRRPAISFGGLKQVADLYHEACVRHGKTPGRLMCSYFAHFADTTEQEDIQRSRQIRYYKECAIPALPGDPKTTPPSYRYFVDMVESSPPSFCHRCWHGSCRRTVHLFAHGVQRAMGAEPWVDITQMLRALRNSQRLHPCLDRSPSGLATNNGLERR